MGLCELSFHCLIAGTTFVSFLFDLLNVICNLLQYGILITSLLYNYVNDFIHFILL